ncbi:MAG: glucose-6-phosphate isomerase family protein, partial [Eubacteriales bacterium]|nr:glucose-6-phosphate isomerase family protein [Eubacteriales bacterium]
YGAVTYARGRLGDEPIRSQGHIHWQSPHCGCSTPEVYEIWSGTGIIYMQQSARDNPGKCYAVRARPGDVVIVPPGWAHATISADSGVPLTFGAWCDRQYGFDYDDVRAHRGLAWFPLLDDAGNICWERNPAYQPAALIQKAPERYGRFALEAGVPIYTQFEQHPDRFDFVPQPALADDIWENFIP